ncbi:MAG: hypothetical protein LUG91_00100 [Ruminococcus sp.]|nr:hypothetical protein [Ruminococcus sp.]
MAYSAHSWTTGETITATRMNAIETGISNAALSTDVAHVTSYNNAGAHNSIYRGKNLGTSITSTQAGYISDATFTDLYVGDYWVINDVTWRIAGFDCWLRAGSTATSTHHAVIIPDTALYTSPMNSTATTDGAYAGSAMFACSEFTVSDVTYTGLSNAISIIQAAFGSYVLTHDAYLANAATNGYPSARAWYTDRVCDLMTEQMVYGAPVMQQMSCNGTVIGNEMIEKSQLPLFALLPRYAHIRQTWWLQDTASSSRFASVGVLGNASATTATTALGVRPYFLIS